MELAITVMKVLMGIMIYIGFVLFVCRFLGFNDREVK